MKRIAYIIMIHEMNAWPLNPFNQPASQRTSVTLECVAAADASTEVAVDASYYYWLLNGNCCALRSTTSLLAPNTHRKWERTSTRYLVHGTHENHVKTHDSFLMCYRQNILCVFFSSVIINHFGIADANCSWYIFHLIQSAWNYVTSTRGVLQIHDDKERMQQQ